MTRGAALTYVGNTYYLRCTRSNRPSVTGWIVARYDHVRLQFVMRSLHTGREDMMPADLLLSAIRARTLVLTSEPRARSPG